MSGRRLPPSWVPPPPPWWAEIAAAGVMALILIGGCGLILSADPRSEESVRARTELCGSICASHDQAHGWRWYLHRGEYVCLCADGFSRRVP